MPDGTITNSGQRWPARLPLNNLPALLRWYRVNLCECDLRDPRSFRVRFLPTNFVHLIFVHLIKITNKFGQEPSNAKRAVAEIERGRLTLVPGRFDPQRAQELPWIRLIATEPSRIVLNWSALGRGDEAYIRNFGSSESPVYRVLVCKIVGTLRQAITVFPRERLGCAEMSATVWP